MLKNVENQAVYFLLKNISKPARSPSITIKSPPKKIISSPLLKDAMHDLSLDKEEAIHVGVPIELENSTVVEKDPFFKAKALVGKNPSNTFVCQEDLFNWN